MLPAVPIYFDCTDPGRAESCLDAYASSPFTADWGVRIVGTDNPMFNPTAGFAELGVGHIDGIATSSDGRVLVAGGALGTLPGLTRIVVLTVAPRSVPASVVPPPAVCW